MRIFLSFIFCLLGSVISCTDSKSSENTKETQTDTTQTGEKVSVLTSTGNRSQSFAKLTLDLKTSNEQTAINILLNPAEKYQTIYGFGSAITGSTCYNLLKMSKEDRQAFLKETFSTTEGLGQSYIRISIGCSDFSLSEYTLCDKKGIENFALQSEELDYVIPILKEILAINPAIQIIGSPWTAPRWMKVNNLTELKPHNEWTSGHLNPKYYEDYATYFVKWIEAMKSHGIKIDAITIQNEPLNRGNSASMFMGWKEQQAFIKTALGKAFRQAGISTKIYLFDHNFNYDNMADQKEYPLNIYQDSEVAAMVAGAAYHNYGGHYSELSNVHSKRPDKELIFTETSIGQWNEGRNLEKRLVEDMEHIGTGLLNNWSQTVIVWNLLLDENGAPNRELGCKTCYGAVDISSADYKTMTKNSHYYVIGHLASVIKPNAVRIKHTLSQASGVDCSAFENTDGTYAVVLFNKNTENTPITIGDGKRHFTYSVPSNSVVSFRWK
ncbi:MAG: glycoside hydrolase family 30 beta sandwich domain-containing protein [Capnocytophaga sp.]|nr:glycoside hydrolase family 30 beta sandwich domain-containing protein [Capnocytophaga sp.]